ncbi:MAG TPA: AAA family ATPase [Gaiellaceae bacterium]|nr:AAA family ATPase [Gaiellaceae bacterium]
MICPSCSTENRPGRKFCSRCGTALALSCPSCGTANEPDDAFCGDCGTPLGAEVAAAPREAPAAERRLVSVLFADLVGFTPLSESRDAEEVRELLSRYFDISRRIISVYGGTVEKFIGDAVMAVWGTPTATEDDAERAVRAALDLVSAVAALGAEVGADDLRARAGVLTGEAAVTLGAEGEGMVAGDLVNSAARIQSSAPPGTVYVGESTRRATEETVVFEDAGTFELKGKEGLTPLWRALRVVSGLRGSLKSHGLEAPFVGRDRELRTLKDLFHASADERKARLLSVTGIAGIGKSRLAWEFYKYFDGIAETIYWHRGRCLPYGEGVTYWALADMVRMRCRIAEDDDPAQGLTKLRAVLDEHVLDAEERSFVEPRLAHLLGYADQQAHEKHDLFAAWRLFFERLTSTYPTVLVFEDLQWADESLLDFIEYLLDWSRDHPLFVITLARPELVERRPTWGAGRRNFTSVFLEALPTAVMEQILAGLVPGLPQDLRDRILDRAEGVPLYAVETVRMLLDRGLLVQDGPAYRPTGAVDSLEVPETLHALIAARLDGLQPDERRLLEDGAVLGKTFTRDGLAALSGLDADRIDELLGSLVRKEVLGVQADPRSPEHGQYGFLQDLVRHVAYETLSRRERRNRHLAAAEHLGGAAAEEAELVEVIAAHWVAAYEAMPDAEDAATIKAQACEALVRAAKHAESLAAAAEAWRYYAQAAALAAAPLDRAALLVEAGEMAGRARGADEATPPFEEALAVFDAAGDTHAAARASMRLGRYQLFSGQRDEALARLERAFDVLSADEPDEDLASLAALLSRSYWFGGDLERAAARAELALDIAEANRYPKAVVHALRAKAAVLFSRGHMEEGLALNKHGLELALEHDLAEHASTFYFILSDLSFRLDHYRDALSYLEQSLEQARKLGSRPFEWGALSEQTYSLWMLGRWDEVVEMCEAFDEEIINAGGVVLSVMQSGVAVYAQRGELDEARRLIDLFARLESSTDFQDQGTHHAALASLHLAEGRLEEALAAGAETIRVAEVLGENFQGVKHGVVDALEAALALGETSKAEELFAFIDGVPAARPSRFLELHAQRLRARVGGDAAGLEAAVQGFRELETPFWVAVTLLEQAELTGDEPARAEAREIFEGLRARPWIERAAAAQRAEVVA